MTLRRRFCILTSLLLSAPSLALAVPFESLSHGAITDVTLGTTPVGDQLLGEIGAAAMGMMTGRDGLFAHHHDIQFLHQWQGVLAVKGGELAAANPYTPLLGGHAAAMVESGVRWQAEKAWSPYAGLRLGGDLQILLPFTVAPTALNTVNNIDGVGDVNLSGLLRLAWGESYLEGDTALLLTAFAQGWLRRAEVNTPGAAFLDVGVAARLDLARSALASVELLWGVAAGPANPALGLTDLKQHVRLDVDGRKIFSNGMWLGGVFALTSESDTLHYPTASYSTRSAPTLALTVVYGIPLGKQEWP